MPSLKIVLLGGTPDVQGRFADYLAAEFSERLKNQSATGSQLTLQSGQDAQDLQFVYTSDNNIEAQAGDADLVLLLTPNNLNDIAGMGNNKELMSRYNGLKKSESKALFKIIFEGDGRSNIEQSFAQQLPNYQAVGFNNQVRIQFEKIVREAASRKMLLDVNATQQDSAAVGSAPSQPSKVRFISRFLGATLRLVFGAVAGLVVYNPLSSVFAAFSAVQRDYNKGAVKVIGALFILLLSPVFGPLKGLLYDGIYRQARRGWKNGFKSSLSPFYQIPREADLNDFVDGTFNDARVNARATEMLGTPISRRNIIAGIVIVSLVIAAGLAVWLPAVNAALAISTYAAQYGLGSLTLAQLALAASGAALVAGTLLYALGVGVVKLGKVIANAFSAKQQKAHSELEASHDEPGIVSKFFGAVVGAVYGALAGMVIYNPVTSLFTGIRALSRFGADKYKESILAGLFMTVLSLTSFVWMPLGQTLVTGLWGQGKRGWQMGLTSILGFDEEKSAGRKVYKSYKPEIRDVIAGLVITGLVVAAGLAFVVTPVSIFLGIPALLTTYGLAGMATWSLALIAAGATFVATTALYGIGSNVYDLWAERKPASPSLAREHDEEELVTASSTANIMKKTGRSAPTASASADTGPGWFSRNVSTPVSQWWNRKSVSSTHAERESLLREDTTATAGGPPVLS